MNPQDVSEIEELVVENMKGRNSFEGLGESEKSALGRRKVMERDGDFRLDPTSKRVLELPKREKKDYQSVQRERKRKPKTNRSHDPFHLFQELSEYCNEEELRRYGITPSTISFLTCGSYGDVFEIHGHKNNTPLPHHLHHHGDPHAHPYHIHPPHLHHDFHNEPESSNLVIKKVIFLRNVEWMKRLLREIKVVKFLRKNHIPFTNQVKGFLLPKNVNDISKVYMLFEKRQFDLHYVIYNKPLSPSQIRSIMFQMCRSLCLLHENGILHRDMKPSNILIDFSKSPPLVEMCDFGCSVSMGYTNTICWKNVISKFYQPPELLLCETLYDGKNYSLLDKGVESTDVWGLGCIFFELMAKRPLFPEMDSEKLLLMIEEFSRKKSELPKKYPFISKVAFDLLFKLLEYHQEKRISARDILKHEYFHPIRSTMKEVEEQIIRRKKSSFSSSPSSAHRFSCEETSLNVHSPSSLMKIQKEIHLGNNSQLILQAEKDLMYCGVMEDEENSMDECPEEKRKFRCNLNSIRNVQTLAKMISQEILFE